MKKKRFFDLAFVLMAVVSIIIIWIHAVKTVERDEQIKSDIESVLVPFIDTVNAELYKQTEINVILLQQIEQLKQSDSISFQLQQEIDDLKERVRWNFVLTSENAEDIFRLHRWHWQYHPNHIESSEN